MAQWVKHLRCKCEHLSSDPYIHTDARCGDAPAPRDGDGWILGASQFNLNREVQVQ